MTKTFTIMYKSVDFKTLSIIIELSILGEKGIPVFVLMLLCFSAAAFISFVVLTNEDRIVSPHTDAWQSRYIFFDNGWYIDDRIYRENGLEGELDDELGYTKYDYRNKEGENSRNGYSKKTLKTSFGETEIKVPRDRAGEFEPQLVKKNQTTLTGDIEEKKRTQRVLRILRQEARKT